MIINIELCLQGKAFQIHAQGEDMNITIDFTEDNYILQVEYNLRMELSKVWDFIATTQGMNKWFPELNVQETDEGKILVFEVDDFREEMKILSYIPNQEISYAWDSAFVCFQLTENNINCQLNFTEHIPKNFGNDFTDAKKDMAGWLVMHEHIQNVLSDRESNKEELQQKWMKYIQEKI